MSYLRWNYFQFQLKFNIWRKSILAIWDQKDFVNYEPSNIFSDSHIFIFKFYKRKCIKLEEKMMLLLLNAQVSINFLSFIFQLRQGNWIALVTRTENNFIIKMLTFHTTWNKSLGWKPPSLLERAIIANGLQKKYFT